MVGKSSGYLDTLPAAVQTRIKALKHVQEKRNALDKELKKEQDALEKKYAALFAPLYARVGGFAHLHLSSPDPWLSALGHRDWQV